MANWVKVKDSDYCLRYPSKQVFHPTGCTCNPYPEHWHYEDDLEAKPRRIGLTPALLENRGGGRYVEWGLTVYGCIGSSGTLPEGMEVVPLKNKADFAEADRLERMLEEGSRRSQMWFNVYKAAERQTA